MNKDKVHEILNTARLEEMRIKADAFDALRRVFAGREFDEFFCPPPVKSATVETPVIETQQVKHPFRWRNVGPEAFQPCKTPGAQWPAWAAAAQQDGTLKMQESGFTVHGSPCGEGWFVVRDPGGYLYFQEPDAFLATHEPVNAP
jgi:hypothetical protein